VPRVPSSESAAPATVVPETPPRGPRSASPLIATPIESAAIGDHGLIADDHTAGLVGANASIDWLCAPRFDSPSIFAAILDPEKGGDWTIEPASWPARGRGRRAPSGGARQHYLGLTNILVTEFGAHAGTGNARLRITDWMPVRFGVRSEEFLGLGAVCRRIAALGGAARVRMCCRPRFEYGLRAAQWRCDGEFWTCEAEDLTLWFFCSGVELRPGSDGDLRAEFDISAGKHVTAALSWTTSLHHATHGRLSAERPRLSDELISNSLVRTKKSWENWIKGAQYTGPHAPEVLRSALALKALFYEPSGAIVAAPTTSLPEALGGPRNWDYRFCWPRDASFALYGLSLLGFHEEAGEFLRFIARVCAGHELPLQVCYRVDGDADLPEHELPWLRGYRGSRPVRIGNGAAGQFQLDIYGEILDAAYTYAKWRRGLELEIWEQMRRLVEFVERRWRRPDNGIWEMRSGLRHFVYSKVMCWVALDRGVKLAQQYGLPAPIARWTRTRDEIRQAVFARGYSLKRHAFTQSFGDDTLDASVLLLPLVRFIHPREAHMRATVRVIRRHLARGPFVARYENHDEDGVGGHEGDFLICGFWLIDCLTLLGSTAESSELLDRLLQSSNRLGLFSEEIEPGRHGRRPELLGNFPQAFTHMALINACHNLELYPKGVPIVRRRRKSG
jgi:GH15 family glucan-1,4-alpha-glucosidase